MKSLCVRAGVTKSLPGKILQMPLSILHSLAEIHLKHRLLVLLIGGRVYKSLSSIFNSLYPPHLRMGSVSLLRRTRWAWPASPSWTFQLPTFLHFCGCLIFCAAQSGWPRTLCSPGGPQIGCSTSNLPKSSSLRCMLTCPLIHDGQTYFFPILILSEKKRVEFYF